MHTKTVFWLIVIATAAILWIIWYKCNVEVGLPKAQKHAGQLFESGMLTRRTSDPDVRILIDNVDRELGVYAYAAARPRLKPAFDAFVKAWTAEGALSTKTQTEYDHVMQSEFCAKGRMQWNQLLGLFLDGAIWMLALGLALFSDILRDSVGDQSKIKGQTLFNASVDKPAANPPYSLARTQLVMWITIISSIYVYAVFWDGRDPGLISINTTALVLMGISAGTFAAGAIIDTTEIQQGIPRIQDFPSTNNFLEDILSDGDGISIHRFQNFAFTIVAVVVYFYRYANPANPTDVLPVLDGTLLGLTGISGATYLTMKTRENITPPETLPKLTIRLGLSPATTLDPVIVAALTAGGFPNAVVSIVDAVGNTIHPIPDPTAPNFNFFITDLVADIYTITVVWTGLVPAGATTPTALQKTWTGRIDKTIPSPLQILF
jgi:hypothetical protein